ncbi:MAG TPA: hypothetical protein DCM05_13910 [Elusimicrobia bacterium]|nr:hypothetical protein [Elusimicrobiota bacterium]
MKLKTSCLSLFILFAGIQTISADMAGLRSISYSSEQGARTGDLNDAKTLAMAGFDGAGQSQNFVSPPPVPAPETGLRKPTGNLIIGDPSRATFTEPKNPLTKEGKAKPQKSGNGTWWTMGGALALGAAGFFLGGPIGAGIGALVGGLLGFFLGP